LRFDSEEEDLANDTAQWPERSYNLDRPIHKGANRFNFYHHRARKAKKSSIQRKSGLEQFTIEKKFSTYKKFDDSVVTKSKGFYEKYVSRNYDDNACYAKGIRYYKSNLSQSPLRAGKTARNPVDYENLGGRNGQNHIGCF